MYSLAKIKKYWLINKWLVSFLYGFIFSFWILNTSSSSFLQISFLFLINIIFVRGLLFISRWLVSRVYKPNCYYRKNMKLIDVIERETFSWGNDRQIYDSRDDYEKRKEFEISMRTIWFTYLLTLVAISSFNSTILLINGANNYFAINWGVAIAVFFLACAYLVLTILIEGWEFEKVRFGSVNVKRILIDYIPLIILFTGLALWLIIDKNSLESIFMLLSKLL